MAPNTARQPTCGQVGTGMNSSAGDTASAATRWFSTVSQRGDSSRMIRSLGWI